MTQHYPRTGTLIERRARGIACSDVCVVDVIVVGGGPAGRGVAAACNDAGLRVTLVDPDPPEVWQRSYATWRDELPAAVPLAEVMDRIRAFGTHEHEWERPYAVLDNAGLWQHLWRDAVQQVQGIVVTAEHGPTGSTVILQDGRRLATAAVVDASGAARVLSCGRPATVAAAQTAVGLVFDAASLAELLPEHTGVLMDWRQAPDTRGGWPTFLCALRLNAHQVMLAETSLARRPALPLALLRRRLRGRLAVARMPLGQAHFEEQVRIPVDDPPPPRARVITFSKTTGLMHPAVGVSLAIALRSAPWIASAIAAGLATGPELAARFAQSILWPSGAPTAHRLRRQVLRAVLALPPHRVPEFFEVLFTLDQRHRAGLLDPDQMPGNIAAATTALLREAPWPIQKDLINGGLSPCNRQARHGLGGL